MKIHILSIVAMTGILCGCAHWSNGQVQVKLHKPDGMENRIASIYFNGHVAYKTSDQSVTASLMPMKQEIRVEMDGAKTSTQIVRVASGGTDQVVSFNLERE